MRLRPSTCAAALITAGVLAGCGSSASDDTTSSRPATRTVTHTETEVRTPTSTSSSTMSGPTTLTSTSTSTSSAQAQAGSGQGSACVAADLKLRYLGGSGATGHGELGFALTNRTSTPCHTYGYPGVLLESASGAALATTPQHTTDDFFGHTTEQLLTVAPGASVSFRLGVSHMGADGGSAGCTTAAALQVIAPDDTATMRVAIPGGAAECGGAVTVSPLQPGTSAVSH